MNKPVRVLQVVGAMDRGGTETWLMNLLRDCDPARWQFDFLVHREAAGAYDAEVRALGGRIWPCLEPRRPWRYAREFRRILKVQGPFAIVHSHVHGFSGWVLRLAEQAGVPVRVAHSHCLARLEGGSWGRGVYERLARVALHRHATHRLSASREAAAALYGPGWAEDAAHRVLYCGIDLEPFRTVDAGARAEWGWGPEERVVAHVGRFDAGKNHRFLLEVLQVAMMREPRLRALLVGEGPLREATERRAVELGLGTRVRFAGSRPDVPRLLRSVADAFVMPSLSEGLPLAGLEAQAAGLLCLVSDTVPEELEAVPGAVRWMSLTAPPEQWAAVLLEQMEAQAGTDREGARRCMEAGPFAIRRSWRALEAFYAEALEAREGGGW
jgi:glycosyltransferase involved in cell wall biosynthesis